MAYDWLIRSNIQITAQIPLSNSQVLGANGAILDGRADYANFYFDIKSFGFHAHLARRLKDRLGEKLPGKNIFVEQSWDLSIDVFEKLIRRADQIAQTLASKKLATFERLVIRMEDPKPVHVSAISIDPYLLASENQKYAFRFANQFTRNSPFVLIFVIHPWFSQAIFQQDFAGANSAFTRAFCRRTFMQFSNDAASINTVCPKAALGTTFADAAGHLSAIVFLNVWPSQDYPAGSSENKPAPSWVYVNPRATHPFRDARLFAELNPHIAIDYFSHDNY
jgi:hypothetical protein